jgi:hypothetical protein
MEHSQVGTSEIAILSRVLQHDKPSWSTSTAKAILELDFEETDKERMHELSAKARQGTLTRREQAELDNFERVGHLIGLLRSKARRSLKARHRTNGKSKAH